MIITVSSIHQNITAAV